MLNRLFGIPIFSPANTHLWLLLIGLPISHLFTQPDSIPFHEDAPFNPRFETFELPGGILGNKVNCIIQDSLGFLWLASQRGLHRYDGHFFKTYSHDLNDPQSLSHSYIEWLCLAEDGGLWVGTFGGGLNYFDPASETAIRYEHKPNDSNSLSNNSVSMVTVDPNGMVWVATFNGLNRLDPFLTVFIRSMTLPSGKGKVPASV